MRVAVPLDGPLDRQNERGRELHGATEGPGCGGPCVGGDGDWEEVDQQLAGAAFSDRNYGWPCYEGDAVFSGCGMPSDFTFPILTQPHDPSPDDNCSVIGGYRYRGSRFPRLRGWYFYTDWCAGTIWAAEEINPGNWATHAVDSVSAFSFTGFVEDDDSELYLAGRRQLLQVTDPENGICADGFESGDTTAW